MQRSKQSILCEKLIKLTKTKQVFVTRENTLKLLEKRRKINAKAYFPPLRIMLTTQKKILDNMDYYIVKGNTNKVVLYLHGGAFVYRPLPFHWTFIMGLVKKTGATVYVPIYPLAPEYSFIETYNFLIKLYKEILKKTSSENITIMGDSAGGTISIGMGVYLKENNLLLPKSIISLSGCFDISFSNPEIEKLNECDVMLHSVGCKIACKTWARGDIKNPLTSPLFANLEGMPKMLVFVGTSEIMLPDTKLFVKKARLAGCNIDYYEKEAMDHVFPLYPVPEGKEARNIIYKTIKNI